MAGSAQPDSLARAETCYRQCLDRNPNHRDCHRGLAVLLIEENRTPEAFALIQNWAAQSPSQAEPRMELARLYQEFGNKEAATNTLADAVQRNPNDARQWAALGKVREETGNYTQALANYQRSLEINPGQADVAARVAALQGAMAPQPLALPPPPGAPNRPLPVSPRRRPAVASGVWSRSSRYCCGGPKLQHLPSTGRTQCPPFGIEFRSRRPLVPCRASAV